MNILYYLDYFPKLSESFILNEIHYLVEQGHNVAVFSLNEPESEFEHEEYDEIQVDLEYADHPRPGSVLRVFGNNASRRRQSFSVPFDRLRYRIGTRFLTEQCLQFVESLAYDIDHVHSHFARWNKVPAALTAEAVGATSSLTTHAYDLYASPDELLLETTCDSFDALFTISEYNRQFIELELDPVPPVQVVRMGVRTEKFTPTASSEGSQLITIARFVEKKGIEYALHAISNCVETFPQLDYRVIGSGPRRERYDRIIDDLGIEENVTFLGSVSDDELIAELDAARGFVLPCVVAKDGDRDGIPVVLMESMAMETPPITTNISGIPELVEDGVNGYLCAERDVESLTESLQDCLREEATPLGGAARETIKNDFDTAVTGPALERKFLNVTR